MASRWGALAEAGAALITRPDRPTTMPVPRAVVAVGSRDKAKAERFCAECGVGQAVAYGSYQDVLGDPAVEAVYIPLPTGLHLEWVRKAAAAGKHIMLEKPIALVRFWSLGFGPPAERRRTC